MDDNEILLLMVIAALFVASVAYLYFRFKGYFKKSSSVVEQIQESVPRSQKPGHKPQSTMSAMYIPKHMGHNTGQKRVFNTNKGLRSYYVTAENTPLAGPKTVPI